MLERAMRSYTNRSLDAAEVIVELVALAKQLREERNRGSKLGLRDDEVAFYDAVCQNDSAVLELGDDVLKAIAHELVAGAYHRLRVTTPARHPAPREIHASIKPGT